MERHDTSIAYTPLTKDRSLFSTPNTSDTALSPGILRIPPKLRYDAEEELQLMGKKMVKHQKRYFILLLLAFK
jgi:hypothetical protein